MLDSGSNPGLSRSRPFDDAPFRGAFHVDGNAVYQELTLDERTCPRGVLVQLEWRYEVSFPFANRSFSSNPRSAPELLSLDEPIE